MSSSRADNLSTKVQKAKDGHYYIHVSKKDDKFRTSHIKLTGFEQFFRKDSTFVYARSIRLAGKTADLTEYLGTMGYAASDIQGHLSNSYTGANAESKLAEIEAEINAIPSNKKEKREIPTLDEIIGLKTAIEGFKPSVALKAAKEAVPEMVPLKVRSSSRSDLASRLTSLEDDKVMDITSYDPSKNTGIKTVKRPKSGPRRALSSNGVLNKVVFDFTKPTDVVVSFLMSLGHSKDEAVMILAAAESVKPVLPTVA